MIASLVHFAVDYSYNYNYAPAVDQGSGAGVAAVLFGFWFAWLAVVVFLVIAIWKMYTKAGKPGWAALVPFYNTWVLAEIAGKPGWWMFLMFIPFVNIVIALLIALGLAHNFGKNDAFGIFALWLFSIVGYPILGFGSAKYKGAAAPATGQPAAPVAPAPMQ